jgi:hypothetical protein
MLAVKVLDSGLSGTGSGIAAGVVYAVDAGAKILNLSLSGDEYSTPLQEALSYARSKGVLAVVAAGNDGRDISVVPAYPASFGLDNIIAVAAIRSYQGAKLPSSNFGRPVFIAALGEDMLTTLPGGQYGTESGTSFATPVVAAAAAMYWVGRPLSRYDQVANAVFASGQEPEVGRAGVPRIPVLLFDKLIRQTLDDRIPPGPISPKATARDSNTVELQWFSDGEDGGYGRAESYEVRWSLAAMNDSTFPAAHEVLQNIRPTLYGVDSILVTDLPYKSLVYFAVRARDRVHNLSSIQYNAVVSIGLPPTLVTRTDKLVFSLHTNASALKTVKFYNVGERTLIGDISTSQYPYFTYSVAPGGTHFELAPGDSGTFRLRADASDLPLGTVILDSFAMTTNDPVHRSGRFTVELDVIGTQSPSDTSGQRTLTLKDPRPAPIQADRFAASIHPLQQGATRFSLGEGWLASPANPPRILDVTGREVARLALNATGTELSWDGRTANGRDAASGIYFLKLEAPGRSRVLRFVRIR